MEGLPSYEKDERPWGHFERFTANEPSTVKIITVRPNEAFSLQRHGKRSEFWYVLDGAGTVTVGDVEHDAAAGMHFFIKEGQLHRAAASQLPLVLLEIALGAFDESDIERIEDRYGRK